MKFNWSSHVFLPLLLTAMVFCSAMAIRAMVLEQERAQPVQTIVIKIEFVPAAGSKP